MNPSLAGREKNGGWFATIAKKDLSPQYHVIVEAHMRYSFDERWKTQATTRRGFVIYCDLKGRPGH